MKLIPIKDFIYILRISPDQLTRWTQEGKLNLVQEDSAYFVRESDFKKLAYSDDVKKMANVAFQNETKRRNSDEVNTNAENFIKKSDTIIQEYKQYINELEKIHKYYHDNLDILHDETPTVAAYIIFSRVITLLKMACYCFEGKFNDAFILVRLIDEALDLAHYFIVCGDSENGATYLAKWFRENYSPSNSICRKGISEYYKNILPSNLSESHHDNMKDLYHHKSKSVHHSINGILEFYKAKIENDDLKPEGFDYGNCSYPRKLFETIEFFRSSIWSSYQVFYICFYSTLGLKQEHAEYIDRVDKTFLSMIS